MPLTWSRVPHAELRSRHIKRLLRIAPGGPAAGVADMLTGDNRIEALTASVSLERLSPYFTRLTPRSQDGGALPSLVPHQADVGEGQQAVIQAGAAVSGIALLVRAVQARLDSTAGTSGGSHPPPCPWP